MANIEISEIMNYGGYTIWDSDKSKFILKCRYNKYFDDDEIEQIIGTKNYEKLQQGKFKFNITQKTLKNI